MRGSASWRTVELAMKRVLLVVILALLLGACGSEVDPTPEKKDGTPSYEFEQDDIEAAENASDAVKEYCADAVSEAQRVGCEAHVTEDDIP
jgi:major membrane immunogen (membrane-anchored lipoprotein)